MNFTEFGFDPRLVDAIDHLGYVTATPIQEQAIPAIMEGHDLIGSAQTGTGKTAAFLLPILDRILVRGHSDKIRALVIVPTRELAVQIDQHMEGLSYYTPVSSIPVYGGTDGASFSREKLALTQGADMVICTPGRMIAHLNMGYVDFSGLEYLVLDEADRMLDLGFYDDILKIIQTLPAERQNLLFSATMPDEIRKLAGKILRNPVEIMIAMSKPAERILQLSYVVYERQKIPLVKYLLGNQQGRSILVFCSTKSQTRDLCNALRRDGFEADYISSDLDQPTREKVLMGFRSRQRSILIATDVLSRGIDIEDIDMVINYDVPQDAEDYIHRIGRTARAAASGVAITLISDREQRQFAAIEKLLGKEVHKAVVPVQLGESPAYEPFKKGHSSMRRKGGKPHGKDQRSGKR